MLKDSELGRHWPIVIGSGIGIGASVTGIPFYTLGLFVDPLQQHYGWTRAEVQGMFSVFTFTGIFFVPLIGWLTDTYGVRKVALFGLVGAALGYLLLGSITHSLATFYLAAGLLAVLAAGTTPITWTKAISGWFNHQRGLALGLALSGTGIAGLLAPVYVSWLLGHFGWRGAYWGLSLIPLLAFPVVYWLFKNPSGVGVSNKNTTTKSTVNVQGVNLYTAIRDYRFWIIVATFFFVSIAIGGAVPNLVPLLMDASFERKEAAALAGAMGIAVITGRVVAGFALDRIWAPAVTCALLGLPAISAIILGQSQISVSQAMLSIALIGFAAGAEFDLIAYLVSRYFGLAHYGKIYSVPYVIFVIGAGIGSPLFAHFYDVRGSYRLIMSCAAALFVLAALLPLLLGKYPDFEKNEIT